MVFGRLPVVFYFVVMCATSVSGVAVRAQTKSASDCPLSSQSSEIQRSYQSGVAALQQNDVATARRHFELLLKQSPKCAELHDLLGYAMLRQTESKPAIREFETAVRLNPGFQLALVHLAEALADDGQSYAAIDRFRQALALAEERSYCLPDDIKRLVIPVFAHRIAVSSRYSSAMRRSEEAEAVLREIIKTISVPL